MNLLSFCRRAVVAAMALGTAALAALTFWHAAPAGPAVSLVRHAVPELLAAAAAAAADGPAALPPAAAPSAAPEPPAVGRASVPASAAPIPRPVHRSPEPRAGHPARAVAAGGARDHVRPAAHALRTAAELAAPPDQGYVRLAAPGARAWASRRTY